jgi:hypothetical protein
MARFNLMMLLAGASAFDALIRGCRALVVVTNTDLRSHLSILLRLRNATTEGVGTHFYQLTVMS